MVEQSKLAGMIEQKLDDTQEGKLQRNLLILACAFMNFAVMLWLAIYWAMGQNFSSNVPMAYQSISITSLLY